jgi:hypothetical protein
VEEEYGKPVLTIKVLDDNFQQVGLSKFKQSKKGVVSLITSFRPEYQGQGIARNIYAYVRMLGNTIVPSRNQLPPGRAMWAAWKKSGDAKHLMTDVAENFAEGFTNYQGLRPPKNILGTNLFPGQDIVGQRVYHCTNRLEAIKKSGGLKPRRDATGEREYGRLSTDEHPFIPVIGIWFSVGKPDWPGKHCVSFIIEPTDQVYVAYASIKGLKPNVVLNPIALDRLTIEGQQDVKENFADGRNPQDKGDAKRHGINTKASVSSLRKTAKQGGRKGQLAHWLANMKAGRAKKNKTNEDTVATINLGSIIVNMDDHALDRQQQRGISNKSFDSAIRKLKLPRVINQMSQLEVGNRFYVLDHITNVALGMRKIGNAKYVLKTVLVGRPADYNIADIITV